MRHRDNMQHRYSTHGQDCVKMSMRPSIGLDACYNTLHLHDSTPCTAWNH